MTEARHDITPAMLLERLQRMERQLADRIDQADARLWKRIDTVDKRIEGVAAKIDDTKQCLSEEFDVIERHVNVLQTSQLPTRVARIEDYLSRQEVAALR